MRKFSLPVALVLVLSATIALAAKDQLQGQFTPLTAQGIQGEVRLNPMKDGSIKIQGHLQNLAPSTEYVASISADDACSVGVDLISFTSNPAGKAVFNTVSTEDVAAIQSIGVRLSGGVTNEACADILQ